MQIEEKTINLSEIAGDVNAFSTKEIERPVKLTLTDLANGKIFSHYIEKQIMIGRNADNDLVIDNDKTVSGMQCRIYISRTGCRVEDTGSANGTFLNGKLFLGSAPLNDNDRLSMGKTNFLVSMEVC